MQNETELLRFPVELSEEEYVRSQELLSRRINGKRVGTSRLFSVSMMVLCALSAFSIYKQTGTPDWPLFILLILMFISELWLMIALPHQLRRRYKMAYYTTLYTGYSFRGTVTVEEDAVRKQTVSATASIPYHTCRVFAESADMMVFCGADGHSIVLPARFLTAETAQRIRKTAFAHIPPARRLLVEPLVPAVHVEPVDMAEIEEETLLSFRFSYTEKELFSMAIDSVLLQFYRTLPNKCLLATVIAAVLYFGFYVSPLPVFLLSLLLFLLGSLFGAWRKSHLAATPMKTAPMRVDITNRGLRLAGKENPAILPWNTFTRAVEQQDAVEFYADTDRQFVIPKRCIDDMNEFRRIVDMFVK